MSTRTPLRLFVTAALAMAATVIAGEPAARAQAIEPELHCGDNPLPPNDDDYSGPVDIGFDVHFGGAFYSTLQINTNGYVSFGSNTPVWWALHNWEQYNIPLIALFHADVDTRGPASGQVTWGRLPDYGGHPALCVNWVNVGYFDQGDDLLNSFQLILQSRSDRGAGDFDIFMNYGQIQWDDSTQPGVIAPRVGIYDGHSVVYEAPGSNTTSQLIDGGTNALVSTAVGSFYTGRLEFPFEGGLSPTMGVVSGTVTDGNGAPVAGALVEACPSCPGLCADGTVSDSGGHYTVQIDPTAITTCSDWNVTVFPPADSILMTGATTASFPVGDTIVTGADVTLPFPAYIPSGTSITPSTGGYGTVPRVYWQSPLTLTTTGCAGGTARYMITSDGGSDLTRCDTGTPGTDGGLVRCGGMDETPPASGTYVASLEPLYPAHGTVKVTMGLVCPDGTSGQSAFDMYIDPSGWVLTLGGAPLSGATVTLFRAESPLGPFRAVPSGSALMSPKNRTNPDHTDAAGHFGWDTVAGYYVVRAEYPGCVAPGDPTRLYVETDVLAVPPEWTDLHLYLDCGAIEPPRLSLPAQVVAEAASTAGAAVTFEATAVDANDGPVPVVCAPESGSTFAPGTTTVTCWASNFVGNVAEGTFPVIVTYGWGGVRPPLAASGQNVLRRGRTVPVKLALGGASAGIADLAARLYVAAVIGGVPALELPATSHGGGGNLFRYDAASGEYVLNWTTAGLSLGTYQLRIDLGDGVPHTLQVELR